MKVLFIQIFHLPLLSPLIQGATGLVELLLASGFLPVSEFGHCFRHRFKGIVIDDAITIALGHNKRAFPSNLK